MDDDEVLPEDLLEDEHEWLYRGMFLESSDLWRKWEECIEPRDLTKRGRICRDQHSRNDDTETAYTSWSTERDKAQEFGEEARSKATGEGEVVVFKVPVRTLANRCFHGYYEDESEILIEGTVEDVLPDEEEEENG